MYRAVLFDFDGTLTRPGAIDFAELRRLLACPAGTPILEYIDGLADEPSRREAHGILDGYELAAARASVPNDGAEDLVHRLRAAGVAVGILTRNSLASVKEALKSFPTVSLADFPAIVTREDRGRPKPHPDGVHRAAELLGVTPAEMLVVGDYVFDIAAGRAAGAATAFLTNGAPPRQMDVSADYTVQSLDQLAAVVGIQDRP
jgi:hydrogenase expression/formation protein HypE